MTHLNQGQSTKVESRWRAPRLRIISDSERERHSGWIELFFDLVFAVVVAVLSQNLRHNLSVLGFVEFVLLFVPCWWAWVLFTFYADRYDTDDVVHRLLILTGMLAVIFLTVNARNAFNGSAVGFAVSYVLVRSVVLLLYLRAALHVPVAKANLKLYLASYLPSTCLWLFSTLWVEPVCYLIWVSGMVIELLVPIFGSQMLVRTPAHPSHLPERFGLCTLIVMGEAIISVTSGTAATNWQLSSVLAAVGGFIIAACLFWIYFNFLETAVLIRGIRSVHIYNYGHLPILIGLILVAVGIQHAIEEANASILPTATRWALCGGVELYIVALVLIRLMAARSSVTWLPWFLGASVTIPIGLALVGRGLAPLALEGLLLIVLVVKVGIEIWQVSSAVQVTEKNKS